MNFDWSQYLDLAQSLFAEATNVPHSDANLCSAISRAYYATYHKARIRLYSKWGITAPTDASGHRVIRDEFKKKSQKQIAATLHQMRIDRNKADYDDLVGNLEATARVNLNRAKQVIADLSTL